ncbi:hypothetical protein R1flu_012789 [Riccia fluitans]|uniref:DUF309 domain-containing protein n=1 Tax=Riccia fluitans TaxID=41844 RepID=A0ABD1ZF05_9MARC
MVTRFERSVWSCGIRSPPVMVKRRSVGAENFGLAGCPCRQLDTPVAVVDASVSQRERSQGMRLLCYHLYKSGRCRRVTTSAWRWNDEEIAEDALGVSFKEGVKLFNAGEYYQCHDVLESLWNDATEPQRSILHGILQCAVGLYHLLHQNHKGAMVELGEGLTKLRRVGVSSGPLYHFEQEASAVLEFIYSTQLEHAACSDDMCITMDGSEQSYRLLGNFGAGQVLYKLAEEADGLHIHFISQRSGEFVALHPSRVKVPVLQAEEEDLYKLT